jgi:hypothetical protein
LGPDLQYALSMRPARVADRVPNQQAGVLSPRQTRRERNKGTAFCGAGYKTVYALPEWQALATATLVRSRLGAHPGTRLNIQPASQPDTRAPRLCGSDIAGRHCHLDWK